MAEYEKPVDVSAKQDGGVLKVIKRPGVDPEDKPWPRDRVRVHYTGTLMDGTEFDSSRRRGECFSFTLGKGEVIKGWDQGVASMVRGELAVFTIRSEYGYGDSGSPPKIPPGATLKFEIELISFNGEDVSPDKNNAVIKRIVEPGQGFDKPNVGGVVTIDVVGRVGNKVFDERKDVTFTVGEGLDKDIPRGVEIALEKMKKLEHAHITLTPEYGFGLNGDEKLQVAKGDITKYDVTLKNFERAKESWQLDGDQKLEQAKVFKEKGTTFFKQGKFAMAEVKYQKVIEMIEHEISLKGEQEEERSSILQAGRLNLALCFLKKSDWIAAKDLCSKVIEEDSNATKAYFRRGEALLHLNEHELAKKDFSKVLELDAGNKAASSKVQQCQHMIKLQREKDKKTFAKMFDRFAEHDNKVEQLARSNQAPLVINEWEGKKGKASSDQRDDEKAKGFISVNGDVKMELDINEEIGLQGDEEEEAVP